MKQALISTLLLIVICKLILCSGCRHAPPAATPSAPRPTTTTTTATTTSSSFPHTLGRMNWHRRYYHWQYTYDTATHTTTYIDSGSSTLPDLICAVIRLNDSTLQTATIPVSLPIGTMAPRIHNSPIVWRWIGLSISACGGSATHQTSVTYYSSADSAVIEDFHSGGSINGACGNYLIYWNY